MPDAKSARTARQRAADHAAIDRLADELLPALVAKLGATGLGEIEVREGPWKVRLRRPPDGANLGRRTTDRAPDRASRAQPGHAGHGHAPGAMEGHRAEAHRAASSAGEPSTNGRERLDPSLDRRPSIDAHRTVATSPAVGVYRPRSDLRAGSRVRAGDRIGSVDMLGVPLEVVAPADGTLGASLVDAGQAVEYGQELAVVELVGAGGGHAPDATRRPDGSPDSSTEPDPPA